VEFTTAPLDIGSLARQLHLKMLVAKGLSKVNLTAGGDVSTAAGAAYALPVQKIEVTSSFTGVVTIPNNDNHVIVDLDVGSNSVGGNGSTPIVYNNSNSVTLRISGSGKIGSGTISGGSFVAKTTDANVSFTDGFVPYATSDSENYTLPQTTKSKVNGLSTFVTTTSGVARSTGGSSTDGNGTGTYTVAQTGRVYFIVLGGGGGGGEWFGRGPGGGAGGGAYGYFNSLSASTSISINFGGSGSGNGSDAKGSGGQSKLTIAGTALVTANGGAGGQTQGGGGGAGGTITVVTNNGTYPVTSTTTRNGTAGGNAPGNGGQSWFTQDGEDDYNWRTNTVDANPGQVWVSGTNHGWGDGGGGGAGPNKGGNSGAPGIVFLWQDSYTVTNAGDPYYPEVKAFGGTGVTTDAQGTPTSGISLTSFSGEYTRAELS
jgi:hypothetical protein